MQGDVVVGGSIHAFAGGARPFKHQRRGADDGVLREDTCRLRAITGPKAVQVENFYSPYIIHLISTFHLSFKHPVLCITSTHGVVVLQMCANSYKISTILSQRS